VNRRRLVLGSLLAAGLLPGSVEAYSASYEQRVTSGGQVIRSTVRMQEERFRMESVVEGQTSIVIRNEEGMFSYLPAQGMAVKLPSLDPSQQPVEALDDYAGYLRERQAELIRTEMLEGKACDVYRFTDPAINGPVTAWVWKERQFPIRLEMDGPDGHVVVELSNIQVGASADPAAFQLPAGVPIMDMGSMGLERWLNAESEQ